MYREIVCKLSDDRREGIETERDFIEPSTYEKKKKADELKRICKYVSSLCGRDTKFYKLSRLHMVTKGFSEEETVNDVNFWYDRMKKLSGCYDKNKHLLSGVTEDDYIRGQILRFERELSNEYLVRKPANAPESLQRSYDDAARKPGHRR